MENIYLLMLVALVVLAIADLVVGVSNDAVNFLNSAIGSKAISFKTIMIVASLGIFIGAVFSSGMMEVARKGIFMPGQFYFDEIMIIFMAVMITDILLLDFFNTLGMPTSTTVSIVFELLGAAVVMALIKVSTSDTETLANLSNYINTEKAAEIISGIFLSVVIAFTIGALVQWLSRLVFSFEYEKKIKNFGALFGGVCLTAIGYFIFFKGLKGTPYYDNFKDVLSSQVLLVVGVSFIFWTLFSWLFMKIFKRSILIIVIAIEIRTPATVRLMEALIMSKAGCSSDLSPTRISSGFAKLLLILLFVLTGRIFLNPSASLVLPATTALDSIFGSNFSVP